MWYMPANPKKDDFGLFYLGVLQGFAQPHDDKLEFLPKLPLIVSLDILGNFSSNGTPTSQKQPVELLIPPTCSGPS